MGTERLGRMLLAVGVSGALALSLPSVSGAASTFAWGEGTSGALGVEDLGAYGTAGEFSIHVTVPAPQALVGVTSIAAGSNFGLAVAGGTVYSWGRGSGGALGNGTKSNVLTPTPVPGLGPATQVAAAASTGYALMADGTVEAWGRNNRGQLGQGTHSGPETCEGLACSTFPAPVPGLSHVRAISAGESHVLALLEDGTVEAWGSNGFGQVGDATTEGRDAPVAVGSLSEVVAVAAGAWFSEALLANGEVRTWGLGDVGQLGNGATNNSSVPRTVSGLTEVTAIAAGESHALALLGNGEVRSWGLNSRGQLGDGTSENQDVPVAVAGLTGASAIAAGAEHSLAIVAGGVESWGKGNEGQLGDGHRQPFNYPPYWVKVPAQILCGLQGITGIAAGGAHSYAWGADQETCPGVDGVEPDLGLESGGTEVTITGTGFGSASAVSFGSTPASSFTVESAGRIRAIAPASAESTVDVTVTNAKGTSVTTPLDRYFFTGIPTVTGVSKTFSTAGTEVFISGTNFNTTTSVQFGAVASPSVTVLSGHSIRATVPPGEGLVDITVRNPIGTSAVGPVDEFLYRTVYEFGRCIKVGVEKSSFVDAGCPELARTGPNEWFPAAFGSRPLERSGVRLGPGSVTFETKTKLRISCSGVQGAGHITGYDLISVEELTLTGCASPKLGTCASSGAASGEVRANPVSAWLGRVASRSVPMVQLEPASGEVLAQMSCGSHEVTVTGSFIGQIGKAGKMLSSRKISATEHKGMPAFAELVNRPSAGAGVQVDGGALQPAGVKLKVTETNEEPVEIR